MVFLNDIDDHAKRHHFRQACDLSLLILILSIHDFSGVQVHHYPGPCRKIWSWIVKVEDFGHRFEILRKRGIVVRVVNIFFVQVTLVLMIDPVLRYFIVAASV